MTSATVEWHKIYMEKSNVLECADCHFGGATVTYYCTLISLFSALIQTSGEGIGPTFVAPFFGPAIN